MDKTIKSLFEIYKANNTKDDGKFTDVPVEKKSDESGNGDDVFKASNVKAVKRHEGKDNHGYEAGEDNAAYEKANKKTAKDNYGESSYTQKLVSANEEVEQIDEISKSRPVGLAKAANKNLVGLRDGSVSKKIEKEKSYTQWSKELEQKHKAEFKTHKEKYAYHKGQIKELGDLMHDIRSGAAGVEPEHRHGAEEEIQSLHDRHAEGMEHHLNQMHHHNSYLDKPYQIKESAEQIDEISHETRKNWLHKTFQNHMKHRVDDPNSPNGWRIDPPKKAGEMPMSRQRVFFKAQDKVNAEYAKQDKERKAAELNARTPKVHDLRHMSHGEVYDHTQTSDKIHNGDVLHVKGGVAAMIDAWPTMIHGKSDVLHSFKAGTTIHNIDGGAFHKTGKVADKLHGIKEEVESLDERNAENKLKKDVFVVKKGKAEFDRGINFAKYQPGRLADIRGHDYGIASHDDDPNDFDKTDIHASRKTSLRTLKVAGRRALAKESTINKFIDTYIEGKIEPASLTDHLNENLKGVNEATTKILVSMFESLDEDNKKLFLETSETSEGINELLDFAIRGGN